MPKFNERLHRKRVQPIRQVDRAERFQSSHIEQRPLQYLILALILAVGIAARTWEFGRLPPGLNPDEASNGIEALSLYRYGTDRNGVSLPVKFISWGSGQDALYAYLLIPLIALGGLSPTVVRLPMLVFGIASLPLLFIVARRIFRVRTALLATFMLAISPWHVLLSRWGLESNFLPLLFLAGFACLLRVPHNGWWFWCACVVLALCLYAYGAAYAFIPVFLVCSLLILVRAALVPRGHLIGGIFSFTVLAIPVVLLVLVNRLGLPSISIGAFTVPRFPVPARWETTTLIGAPDPMAALISNAQSGLRLLAVETDGLLYNVVDPFGYFYRVGLALAVAGLILLLSLSRQGLSFEIRLLLAWLGSAAVVALLQPVNINRFNIIFFPLLLLGAFALDWLQLRHPSIGPASILVLTAAFLAFSKAYHGPEYRRQADYKFQTGLLPALHSALESAHDGICITDKINMPYIYAMFSEQTSPKAFLASVRYVDATEPLRRVASFGRFTFGLGDCTDAGEPTYVLRADDVPPRLGNRYSYEYFDNFVVCSPIR